MTKPTWQEKSQSAFTAYLKELEDDLPKGSTVNDIERKLVDTHQKLLNQILQSRLETEDFPPTEPSKLCS